MESQILVICWKLEYNESKWDFSVTKKDANEIGINSQGGNSKTSCQYVMLFPNETPNTYLRCVKKGIINETEFKTQIQANTLYFESGSENERLPMPWSPYVDLGLPSGVKWAIGNIGASSPEEAGDYYAWGELNKKDKYSILTYELFLNMPSFDISGNEQYDVARKNWGDNWRMPKKEDFQELKDKCDWYWITENERSGYKVVSKQNSKSIFLPAVGLKAGESIEYQDWGYYWSSTPEEDAKNEVYYLTFDSKGVVFPFDGTPYDGRSVRPVYQENSQR